MPGPAKARLFIALDLPSALCRELAAWTRTAVGVALRSGGVRAIAPESMHLTLRFLGSLAVHEIEPLAAIVEGHGPPPQPASLGAPLWLPSRRPRVLAVEVHDHAGALLALERELNAALAAAGLGADPADGPGSAGRVFKPHVTVARMRPGSAPRDRPLPATPQRSFVVPRLVLYRSQLAPSGATYEALAESPQIGSGTLAEGVTGD